MQPKTSFIYSASNPKPFSFTLLQVQPFLIGDIVTTVSKGRDAAATTPANDVQARTALNSFAGILLRSAPLTLQPKTSFIYTPAVSLCATPCSILFKPRFSASLALAWPRVCALRFSRLFLNRIIFCNPRLRALPPAGVQCAHAARNNLFRRSKGNCCKA